MGVLHLKGPGGRACWPDVDWRNIVSAWRGPGRRRARRVRKSDAGEVMGEGRGGSPGIVFRGIFRGILKNRIYFYMLLQCDSVKFW